MDTGAIGKTKPPPANGQARAYEVDMVKDIRDKALAIEEYSRQAKNTEAERRACEIQLRAEKKVGRLLKEMDRAPSWR